jgi:hypothetical protein
MTVLPIVDQADNSTYCAGAFGAREEIKAFTKMTKLREMIEFLAQMPTDAKIFLTMAVLSLAIVLMIRPH